MTAESIDLKTSHASHSGNTGGCACGHADEAEMVLDTRQIPHGVRHAAIFGALGAIAPGFSLDLVANHRPNPLLAQLDERHPGEFEVSFVEDGPELWRLRFTRQQA